MTTKNSMKNIYLVAIISICLLVIGIGSSVAMFTAEATIENPISFKSNLTSTSLISETYEVVVPAEKDKSIDLIVDNNSGENLYYSVWYIPSDDIEVGSSTNKGKGNSGKISSNESFTVSVSLRNNSKEDKTVTLGVSSTEEASFVLPTGAVEIPYGILPPRKEENKKDNNTSEITTDNNDDNNLESDDTNQDVTNEDNNEKED